MQTRIDQEKKLWEIFWEKILKNFEESYDEKKDIWFLVAESSFYHLKRLLPKKNVTSLEVGAGTAHLSKLLAEENHNVCVVDYTMPALKISKKRINNAKVVQADACSLPFNDNSFDLVMSNGTMEHFRDMKQPIKEQARVLKKGGLFFANIIPRKFSINMIFSFVYFLLILILANMTKKDVNGMDKKQIKFHIRYIINFFRKKEAENNKYIHYESKISHKRIKEIMYECGFSDIKIRGATIFPIMPKIPYYVEFLRKCNFIIKSIDNRVMVIPFGMCLWVYGIKR